MGSRALWTAIGEHEGVALVISGHQHHAVARDLPLANRTVPCAVSPIGYPREMDAPVDAHVASRVSVREIATDFGKQD